MAKELIKGINRILLIRLTSEMTKQKATKIIFQTEHSVSSSRSVDKIPTKDGIQLDIKPKEESIDLTFLDSLDHEAKKILKKSYDNPEELQVWDILSINPNEEGKYEAKQYEGYIASWDETANSEDNIEVSMTYEVQSGIDGYATLDKEQSALVKEFIDTVKQEG